MVLFGKECGVRWRIITPEEKVTRLECWHRWFAWYPVVIGDYRYWLTRVYRKGKYHIHREHSFWTWEYCENEFDILKADSGQIKHTQ